MKDRVKNSSCNHKSCGIPESAPIIGTVPQYGYNTHGNLYTVLPGKCNLLESQIWNLLHRSALKRSVIIVDIYSRCAHNTEK